MPNPRLTVWYNTRCPVCDAGIDRQRNKLLAAVKAGTIAFRDINLAPDALAAHGGGGLARHARRQSCDAAAGAFRLRPVRRPPVRLEPAQRTLVRRRTGSQETRFARQPLPDLPSLELRQTR